MRRLRFGDVVSDEAGVVEARVEEMGAMVEVGICVTPEPLGLSSGP